MDEIEEKKHQSKSIDKHTIVVEKKTNLILLILVFFCFDQNYDEKTITSELLFSGAFKYHSKKKQESSNTSTFSMCNVFFPLFDWFFFGFWWNDFQSSTKVPGKKLMIEKNCHNQWWLFVYLFFHRLRINLNQKWFKNF